MSFITSHKIYCYCCIIHICMANTKHEQPSLLKYLCGALPLHRQSYSRTAVPKNSADIIPNFASCPKFDPCSTLPKTSFYVNVSAVFFFTFYQQNLIKRHFIIYHLPHNNTIIWCSVVRSTILCNAYSDITPNVNNHLKSRHWVIRLTSAV